jgi:hypothetical protein
MANEMSRRGWFGIVGGLLAAFGLVPQAKAKAPTIKPPTPSIEYSSYPGATGYSATSATTYVYSGRATTKEQKWWRSAGGPSILGPKYHDAIDRSAAGTHAGLFCFGRAPDGRAPPGPLSVPGQ